MARKVLTVPYFSQRDNVLDPDRSCNVTSLSMVLAYFGIKGDGSGQLEDQLRRYAESKGWSVYEPSTLVKLAAWKGIKDTFTTAGRPRDIVKAIDAGSPLVCHGYYTRGGHILTIVGYETDANGKLSKVIVNDPYGRWTPSGYDRNDPYTSPSSPQANKGRGDTWNVSTFMAVSAPDGDLWLHSFSR